MKDSVTLKKAHFDGCVRLLAGAISNGKWALRLGAVDNAAAFATHESAGAAMGIYDSRLMTTTFEDIGPSGKLHAWVTTKFLFQEHRITARILQSEKTGALACIDARMLAMLDADLPGETFYGVDVDKPFINAETIEKASMILMPFKLDPLPDVFFFI